MCVYVCLCKCRYENIENTHVIHMLPSVRNPVFLKEHLLLQSSQLGRVDALEVSSELSAIAWNIVVSMVEFLMVDVL